MILRLFIIHLILQSRFSYAEMEQDVRFICLHKNIIIKNDTIFEAYDGVHNASVIDDELIEMQMKINSKITKNDYGLWVDTGSPHLIIETTNTDELLMLKKKVN